MLIQISAPPSKAAVLEVEDLKRFEVLVAGHVSDEDIDAALGSLGRVEAGTHAWISIERLRAASDRVGDDAWQAGFDGMISYAASKDWVDATGVELRAHIVRDAQS